MENIPLQSQDILAEEESVLESLLSDADSQSSHLEVEELLLYNLPGLCFPVFEMAHFVITALTLRLEFGKQRARESPLASCFSTLVSCLAGSLMTNMLLGLPPADVFKSDWKVLSITVVWVSVHFSPQDCIFKLVNQPVVFSLLWSIKELERMRKIVTGVALVQAKYPASLFLSVLAGVLRGNGTTIIRPAVRLVSGVLRLDNELTQPGLSTKMCLLAALAWVWTGSSSCVLFSTATAIFLLVRLHNILRLSEVLSNVTRSLSLNSINKNQELQSETEDLSDKKDS